MVDKNSAEDMQNAGRLKQIRMVAGLINQQDRKAMPIILGSGVGIFVVAVLVGLFTAISGITFGKRLLGIQVIRTNGGRPGFGWALLRTVLLFFVVPPLLADRDLRGLHDRAANTIVVRM